MKSIEPLCAKYDKNKGLWIAQKKFSLRKCALQARLRDSLNSAYYEREIIEMKNNNRLYFARQKFLGKCPVCGKTLKKVDGVNILRCNNAACSGVTVRRNGESSQEPYYRMLNDRGMEIYEHLFNKK